MGLEGTGSDDDGCHTKPVFEREWPQLAERLRGLLGARRVPPCAHDDLIQETGLRLFRMWPQVQTDRPLWPLVMTIALNLLRDEARRASHAPLVGAVPDMPDGCNVERSGIARLELARVRRAMSQLNAEQRRALLTEVYGDEAVRATKMQRLRARRRLTAVLERASASGIAVAWWRPLRRLRRLAAPGTVGAAAPAAGLVAAIALFTAAGIMPAPHGAPSERKMDGSRVQALRAADDARAAGRRGSGTIATGTAAGEAARPSETEAAARPDLEPVRVPVAEDAWVETSAQIDLLGIGLDIADNGDDLPACLRGSVDLPLECSSASEPNDGIAGRAGIGIKYEDHAVAADAHILPE